MIFQDTISPQILARLCLGKRWLQLFGLRRAWCLLLLLAAASPLYAANPQSANGHKVQPAGVNTLPAPVNQSPNSLASSSDTILTATNGFQDVLTNEMARLDNQYRLAIGDRINFQVLEDQDDPKSLVVADSGDIEVPYLGPFPAQGKTCRELAVQIKKELERKYYYQATVIISVDAVASRGVIYLFGAVRTPGPLEIPRNDPLTISKAILRAGGFTDFADEKDVRITRQGGNGTNQVFVMDISRILTKGKMDEDKPAEPGDLIFVPEKTIRF